MSDRGSGLAGKQVPTGLQIQIPEAKGVAGAKESNKGWEIQFERARRTLSSLGPAPELVKKSN